MELGGHYPSFPPRYAHGGNRILIAGYRPAIRIADWQWLVLMHIMRLAVISADAHHEIGSN